MGQKKTYRKPYNLKLAAERAAVDHAFQCRLAGAMALWIQQDGVSLGRRKHSELDLTAHLWGWVTELL